MYHEEAEEEDATDRVVTLAERSVITRGKYKGLVLPRMLSVTPEYQERVVALRQQIAADPEFRAQATWLAGQYTALRAEQRVIQEQLSDCNLRLEAVSQMMTAQFEVEGSLAVTLESGANIRVQPEPHAIVTDKEVFREWCVEAGLQRLMALPWGAANKLTKDRLLDGLKEPDGVTAYFRNKIVFQRG